MDNRRTFLKKTVVGTAALGSLSYGCVGDEGKSEVKQEVPKKVNKPIVVCTWPRKNAGNAAWEVLSQGGAALDAVEAGAREPEADPKDRSVGYGGRPDRDGNVTLDACIMDHDANCGSVVYLQHIKHPISVARKVMEETPHIMLAGQGALNFAVEQGFPKENLLTEKSKQEWEEWVKKSEYSPVINIENHDTIGVIALDENGKLSGACTTSGAAYKMQGRIGDSPIIGAGLFVDGDVGAATATGLGEAVIKVVGTHLVVEFMRQGLSPEAACKAAVERVMEKEPNYKNLQVGFIAINKYGEYGGYSIQKGFSYTVNEGEGQKIVEAVNAI